MSKWHTACRQSHQMSCLSDAYVNSSRFVVKSRRTQSSNTLFSALLAEALLGFQLDLKLGILKSNFTPYFQLDLKLPNIHWGGGGVKWHLEFWNPILLQTFYYNWNFQIFISWVCMQEVNWHLYQFGVKWHFLALTFGTWSGCFTAVSWWD